MGELIRGHGFVFRDQPHSKSPRLEPAPAGFLDSANSHPEPCDRCMRNGCGALPQASYAPTMPSMNNTAPPMPAKRALAALDAPPLDPGTAAPAKQRISKKVQTAMDALIAGDVKTIKEAAEKVGLHRESLSRSLSIPHVAAHLRQKVIRHLAIAAARASATKVDLLGSDSEIARDRASSFILGLAGIQPASTPSVSLNLEVKAGYVIDLSDNPPGPGMRIVSRTTTAPIIEHDPDGDDYAA
jgi:hypothetical protein